MLSEYARWERRMKWKKIAKDAFSPILISVISFAIGMATQYVRDSECREQAAECMNRDIDKLFPSHTSQFDKHTLRNMLPPTEAQIKSARSNIKVFSERKRTK